MLELVRETTFGGAGAQGLAESVVICSLWSLQLLHECALRAHTFTSNVAPGGNGDMVASRHSNSPTLIHPPPPCPRSFLPSSMRLCTFIHGAKMDDGRIWTAYRSMGAPFERGAFQQTRIEFRSTETGRGGCGGSGLLPCVENNEEFEDHGDHPAAFFARIPKINPALGIKPDRDAEQSAEGAYFGSAVHLLGTKACSDASFSPLETLDE